jgi:hypothetical protein
MKAGASMARRAGAIATRAYVSALPSRRRLPTHDRRILEDRILPAVAVDAEVHRLLFVGCNEASAWYPAAFGLAPGLIFETIDPDPAAARFGSRRSHAVMRLEALAELPERRGSCDAVVLNGVFNYGTNDDASKQSVLCACHLLLRERGTLVLGHREPVDGGAPDLDLGLIRVSAWHSTAIPGLGTSAYRTDHPNGHTFRAFLRVP